MGLASSSDLSVRRPPRAQAMAAMLTSILAALELDHVLIAVADLAAAGRELQGRHGLHPSRAAATPGTAPPTGSCRSPTPTSSWSQSPTSPRPCEVRSEAGSHACSASEAGPWDGPSVRTRSTPSPVGSGSRSAPARGGRSAEVLRWRLAGLEREAAEPSLPFFIEWAPGTPFPGHVSVRHLVGAVRIAELRLAGDSDRVAEWLGAQRLPITVRSAPPAVASIVLAGAAGEIVLDADQP